FAATGVIIELVALRVETKEHILNDVFDIVGAGAEPPREAGDHRRIQLVKLLPRDISCRRAELYAGQQILVCGHIGGMQSMVVHVTSRFRYESSFRQTDNAPRPDTPYT